MRRLSGFFVDSFRREVASMPEIPDTPWKINELIGASFYEIPVQLSNRDVLVVDRDALLKSGKGIQPGTSKLMPHTGFYFLDFPEQIIFGNGVLLGWTSPGIYTRAGFDHCKTLLEEFRAKIRFPSQQTLDMNYQLLRSEIA